MSKLFLGGLMSGMDTTTIINRLMDVEAARIKVQADRKAAVQAKQTAWNDVKSSLETLRTKLDAIRFSSAYEARRVTSTANGVARVNASSDAAFGRHVLDVRYLSSVHSVASGNFASPTTGLGFHGDLMINGKELSLTEDDTLYSLRDQINRAEGINVKASVMRVVNGGTESYRLVLTSTERGEPGAIQIADSVGGEISQGLGLLNANGSIKHELSEARNASFYLNNVEYSIPTDSIRDAIPGLRIDLEGVGVTTLGVERNTDGIADAITSWVESANAAVALLQEKMSVGAAGRGPLHGDGLARQMLNNLRGLFSAVSTAPGEYNNLNDIGIGLGRFGTANFGKLTVDETKLKAALAADPDSVAKLLGARQHNVALGATVSTTNTDAGNFDPAWLTNGETSSTRFGSIGGGWQSSTIPAKLTFNLGDSAKRVQQLRLFSIDNGTSSGITKASVRYLGEDDQWHDLLIDVDARGSRTLEFTSVKAKAIEIEILETVDSSPARLTEVQIIAENVGVIPRMQSFLNQTLHALDGSIPIRNEALNKQVLDLDKRIVKMEESMARREIELRRQFARMEEALARLQQQGNAVVSQLNMMMNPQNSR